MSTSAPVLEVRNLCIVAQEGARAGRVVEELSLRIASGEVLGIVGESGSGKSVTAAAIAGLLPRGLAVADGSVSLEGRELLSMNAIERRRLAGSRIGMVFQDPLSSFNPVRTVGSLLAESVTRHRGLAAAAARSAVVDAFADVRLPQPQRVFDAYPHQLSGGQRQRAMIALALINEPALLIADEPTTALDATVQLQILALLKRGAGARALLLITHDLAVAAGVCDRILVMHRGRGVEEGTTAQILDTPRHPVTRQLLAAAQGRPRSGVAA